MISKVGKMFMGYNRNTGETYHNLKNPRKDLMSRFGVKSCHKMFIERKGKNYHDGYVVAGNWIQIYVVIPISDLKGDH